VLGFADGKLEDHEDEAAARIGALLRDLAPSHVFVTKPDDHHPDHRALARATRRAMVEGYDSEIELSPNSTPPEVYTYRVYPGGGLWPDGHPDRPSLAMTLTQLVRSVMRLVKHRPLLLRAPMSKPAKIAAVEAYGSQRRLLDGELRYVWRTGIELYGKMEVYPELNSNESPN
jgi:LmbE family N-acetylglucosaminyl deacetylase